MTRDRRVRPAVSSRSAERVCSTSRKPKALKSLLGGRDRERSGTGERVEDRREEQLLVDRPNNCLLALVLDHERIERRLLGSIPESEHPREMRERLGIRGQRMGLVLVDELQTMLDGAQPRVRGVE